MATNYPGSLDSWTNPSASTKMDATGFEHDVLHANAYDALEAIEGELGTDPAGGAATVKARLDAELLGSMGNFYWPAGGYVSSSVTAGLTTSTASLQAGRVYYIPIWLPLACNVTELVFSVSTFQASSNARIGLYDSDSSGKPSSRLVQSTVETASSTVKNVSVSSTAVVPGMHYVALQYDTTGIVTTAPAAQSSRTSHVTSALSMMRGFYEDLAYGSGLPATAASGATETSGILTLCAVRRST